jgi:2,4-didehydro-3-deoxy-L-rhamnonate hydrolase
MALRACYERTCTMESQPFGLGTFAADGDAFAGIAMDDEVIDLRPMLGPGVTTGSLLADWDTSFEQLAQIASSAPSERIPRAQLRSLNPISSSAQVLCAGANYFRHVRQIVFSMMKSAGDPRPDNEIQSEADDFARRRRVDGAPFLFAGLTSALCGANDDIVLWGPGNQHDWELELAVVIGRHARRVPPHLAMDHVAGYTICNDISVRDVMQRPGMPMTDFLSSKFRPTFKPIGPYLVPRAFVPNPDKLRIQLRVNGALMQDESVDDMIYGIEELVSYASHLAELSPGDILLTGSPAGNAGHHDNRWLRPGDVIEAEITGVGRQHNHCIAPPA